jgi:glucose-fructose oxidoreductase
VKIVGISFDHMHMGDLLRQAHECPEAEIAGICDANPANREAVQDAIEKFGLPESKVFSDVQECLEKCSPDLAILCPSTARHASLVEQVAPSGVHMLVEKPFATSLEEADRMIAAARASNVQLVINWPLAWYPPHVTSKRLIDEGVIGDVLEVHYYDGNRGPTYHLADKIEVSQEEALEKVKSTWWYRKDQGGGALLDYLGYGVTLGTWFMDGRKPLDVTCTTWKREGVEVDEHAISAVRYVSGMSKFETRWGTFTDPWVTQPQPKCGFVIVGSAGTIASYDYEQTISVQTAARREIHTIPVDAPLPKRRGPVEHVVDVLNHGTELHGPLRLDVCRIGQQIVDTAVASSAVGQTLPLIETTSVQRPL